MFLITALTTMLLVCASHYVDKNIKKPFYNKFAKILTVYITLIIYSSVIVLHTVKPIIFR